MLQDYEIMNQSTRRTNRLMAVVEFILVLFLIQSALMLFTGQAEQEEEIRFRILSHSNAPADQKLKEEIQACHRADDQSSDCASGIEIRDCG